MTSNELRAGVVGLGMIGGGVAVSLARRGRTPAVYDIRPNAADTLPDVEKPLDSPADVARASDVVMIAVVDADQARAVITGPDGVLAGAHPGLTLVLLSTVALPVVHEFAQLCTEHEVGFLDCGVTPGDKAAENGMVAILGGDEAVVETALPVLRNWAKEVVHCGRLGAGMATKIARNIVTYGSWRSVSEATELAAAAGVAPATLAEVIETADPEGRTLLQLLHMCDAEGELPEAVSKKVEPLMTKDLAAARDLATELDIDIPLTDVARTHTGATLGRVSEASNSTRRERGLAVMDAVYGAGFSASMPESSTPFTDTTAEHLFGEVWSRPGLSVRERRLLVLGATAAIGRADLVQIQTRGALATQDLTPDQLREAVLQLAYYVGWGNATATHQGIEAAIAELPQEKK